MDVTLDQVLNRMFRVDATEGREIIRNGDEGKYAFVAESGRFIGMRGPTNDLREIEINPGYIFGLINPRKRTVICEEEGVLWAVSLEELKSIKKKGDTPETKSVPLKVKELQNTYSALFIQVEKAIITHEDIDQGSLQFNVSISTTFDDFKEETSFKPCNQLEWNRLFRHDLSSLVVEKSNIPEIVITLETQEGYPRATRSIDISYIDTANGESKWYSLTALMRGPWTKSKGGQGGRYNKQELAQIRLRLLLAKSTQDAQKHILKWSDISIDDLKMVSRQKARWRRSRLTIVGKGRSGKTTLIRALRGMEFKNTESTLMADIGEVNVKRVDIDLKSSISGTVFHTSKRGDHALMLAEGIRALKQEKSDDIAEENDAKTELKQSKAHNLALQEDKPQQLMSPSVTLNTDITLQTHSGVEIEHEITSAKTVRNSSGEALKDRVENVFEEEISVSPVCPTEDDEKMEPIAKELDLIMFNNGLSDTGTRVSIWDFAGQEVYYCAHQLFLVRNSVYIITFSLEKWNNPDTCHQEEKFIVFWLQSIRINASDAQFILVGTHVDVLEREFSEDRENQMEMVILDATERLMEIIDDIFGDEEQRFISHRYMTQDKEEVDVCFFPVDSKTRDSKGECDSSIKILRDVISQAFTQDEKANELVPIVWSAICDNLTIDRANQWMNIKSIRDICGHHGIQSEKEIKLMLRRFHELGVIIYFDEEGLREFAVLKPQFLLNAVKRIIYDQKVHKKIHRKTLAKSKETRNRVSHLFQKGILHIDLIDLIWDKNCIPGELSERENHIKFVLKLLQKYMLFCPCDTDEKQYVVPSMLKKSKEDNRVISKRGSRRSKAAAESTNSEKIASERSKREQMEHMFAIVFKRFRPQGFFHMMLARIINKLQQPNSPVQGTKRKRFAIEDQILYRSYAGFRIEGFGFSVEGPLSLSHEDDEENEAHKSILVRIDASKNRCAPIFRMIKSIAESIFHWPFRGQIEFLYKIWPLGEPFEGNHVTFNDMKSALQSPSPMVETKVKDQKTVHLSQLLHWDERAFVFSNHVSMNAKLQTIFNHAAKGKLSIQSSDAISLCTLLRSAFPELDKSEESARCMKLQAACSDKNSLNVDDFKHFMWTNRPQNIRTAKSAKDMVKEINNWKLAMEKGLNRVTVGRIPVYSEAEIKRIKSLGKGNFGSAYLVGLPSGQSAVLKVEHQKQSIDSHELQAMFKLRPHPNLLELKGMVTIDENLCIITEFCELGSLDRLHHKIEMDTDKGIIPVIKDVVRGLRALHRCGIVHRDLACRNIFMKQGGRVVIADYGMARKVTETKEYYTSKASQMLPFLWMSPESIFEGIFSHRGDIWSLGVTIYELLNKGERPYKKSIKKGMSMKQISKCVRDGTISLIEHTSKPNQSKSIKIAKTCLQIDLKSRPSASDIAKTLGVEPEPIEETSELFQNAVVEYSDCDPVVASVGQDLPADKNMVDLTPAEVSEMQCSNPYVKDGLDVPGHYEFE